MRSNTHPALPLARRATLGAALLFGVALILGACSDRPRYSARPQIDEPEPDASDDPDAEPEVQPEVQPEVEPEGRLICVDGSCECPDGVSVTCSVCFPEGELPEDVCGCAQLCSGEPSPEAEPDPDLVCVECACECADGRLISYESCFEGAPDPQACRSDNCAALCDDPDPECPDNDGVCERPCPMGSLRDVFGCPTCACDARLGLATNGREEDVRNVSFEVEAGLFIGGINRWTFDMRWSFDDPRLADEAYAVSVPVRIQQDTGFNPGPDWVTFFIDDPGPLEAYGGRYTLFGVGVIEIDLTIIDGFLSIRQVGDAFEVRTSLILTSGDRLPGLITASAAFTTPVP